MIKTLFKKLRRTNKGLRILYYLILVTYTFTFALFLKSILSLTGIETFIRTTLIIFFALFFGIYALFNLINLLVRKHKGIIISTIVAIFFIGIFSVSSYYINFIYNKIENITEDGELLYTSYLINLKDRNFSDDDKIGIISEETDQESYNLASGLYEKEKLSNETVEYDDYIKLINDLYSGVIGAAFVKGNYISYYQSEDFPEISNETKVLYKHTEKKENEDLLITSDKKFTEPLTFLLMGVDSETEGLKAATSFNGDTLMLVTFNPKTLNVLMLSIPRDTYVPIACKNDTYNKINSAAGYGTSCVINTISNFLDVDIDYYVKVNFKGVVELVDAVGGVEVDVEKPYFKTNNGVNYEGKVCEQNSNRELGDKIVCMNPGWQNLNGEQALAYSRNRHQYIGSDLDRIKHQQQVVEALASKVVRFKTMKEFQDILTAVSNNLATNMDTDTILSGYQVIKNMLGNFVSGKDLLNINKAYLETYSLNVYVPSQGRKTSAQGYYTDSLNDIKKALKVYLGKEEDKPVKTFSFNINDTYKGNSPGKGKRTGSSGELLPNFVGQDVEAVKRFCETNNIELTIRYVDPESQFYNPNIGVGLVGNQSVHKEVLLSTVKELTVYIVNSRPTGSEE